MVYDESSRRANLRSGMSEMEPMSHPCVSYSPEATFLTLCKGLRLCENVFLSTLDLEMHVEVALSWPIARTFIVDSMLVSDWEIVCLLELMGQEIPQQMSTAEIARQLLCRKEKALKREESHRKRTRITIKNRKENKQRWRQQLRLRTLQSDFRLLYWDYRSSLGSYLIQLLIAEHTEQWTYEASPLWRCFNSRPIASSLSRIEMAKPIVGLSVTGHRMSHEGGGVRGSSCNCDRFSAIISSKITLMPPRDNVGDDTVSRGRLQDEADQLLQRKESCAFASDAITSCATTQCTKICDTVLDAIFSCFRFGMVDVAH